MHLIYTLAQFYLKLKRTSHGCCDKKALTHNAENVHMSRLFCEVYKVIKFVSDMRHVSGFLRLPRFPPPIKVTATILLKYC